MFSLIGIEKPATEKIAGFFFIRRFIRHCLISSVLGLPVGWCGTVPHPALSASISVPLDVIQAHVRHVSIQTKTAIYGSAPTNRMIDELGKAFS